MMFGQFFMSSADVPTRYMISLQEATIASCEGRGTITPYTREPAAHWNAHRLSTNNCLGKDTSCSRVFEKIKQLDSMPFC